MVVQQYLLFIIESIRVNLTAILPHNLRHIPVPVHLILERHHIPPDRDARGQVPVTLPGYAEQELIPVA